MRKCLVALCHNQPTVARQTAQSLMELGWGDRVERAKVAHGFDEISFVWVSTFPRVDSLRDAAADLAVAEGFSHLLFLDADMVFPTDLLVRMLGHHDKGIVGGLYVTRHEPFAPVALTQGFQVSPSTMTHYWYDRDAIGATELRPVEVLGMGCTLIQVGIFQQIGPRPWFEYVLDDQGWPRVTEDVPFCQKASKAGVALWLDPTIRCGHVTTMISDHRWAKAYQQAEATMLERATATIRVVEAPVG